MTKSLFFKNGAPGGTSISWTGHWVNCDSARVDGADFGATSFLGANERMAEPGQPQGTGATLCPACSNGTSICFSLRKSIACCRYSSWSILIICLFAFLLVRVFMFISYLNIRDSPRT